MRLSRFVVLIVILALTLGRITGRLLRLQKGLNRLGQYARERFAQKGSESAQRWSEGFVTCTILFCVGPMAILGALQDGLSGRWQTLGAKAIMDGLATMAFMAPPLAYYMPKEGKDDPDLLAAWRDMNSKPTKEERKAAFARAQEAILTKALAFPFGSLTKVQASRANVEGFVPFRIPRMSNVWFSN